MRVSFVIVHYHTPDLAERAVAAVREEIVGCGIDAELLLVDNGSNSTDSAKLDALGVRVLRPESNLGYAGGVNFGAAHAGANVLVLMNADVEPLPGCTSRLVRALENGAAAAGPRFFLDRGAGMLLPPTERQTRCDELLRRFAERGGAWARPARRRWRVHARRHWCTSEPLQSSSLSGALLAVTAAAWRTVGPFDERYRLYFEEMDWLARLSRQGLRAVHFPEATALHHYNRSAAQEPNAAEWFAASRDRYLRARFGAAFAAFARSLSPAIAPATALPRLPAGPPRVPLPAGSATGRPIWIELSTGPRRFPAAAARVTDPEQREWRMPSEVWDGLAPGVYTLLLVDDAGTELDGYECVRERPRTIPN